MHAAVSREIHTYIHKDETKIPLFSHRKAFKKGNCLQIVLEIKEEWQSGVNYSRQTDRQFLCSLYLSSANAGKASFHLNIIMKYDVHKRKCSSYELAAS